MGHVEVTLIFLCVVVQLLSLAHQASLSFTISRSLLKLMSIELVMLPNHLIYSMALKNKFGPFFSLKHQVV